MRDRCLPANRPPIKEPVRFADFQWMTAEPETPKIVKSVDKIVKNVVGLENCGNCKLSTT